MNPSQPYWAGAASAYFSQPSSGGSVPVASQYSAVPVSPDLPSLSEDGTSAWNCPRCAKYNPGMTTTCDCGYLNIGLIEKLRPKEPERNQTTWVCRVCGITQTGDNTGTCKSCNPINENPLANTVWKCACCNYEYNQVELRQCQKCSTPNPAPQPVSRAAAQQVTYSLPAQYPAIAQAANYATVHQLSGQVPQATAYLQPQVPGFQHQQSQVSGYQLTLPVQQPPVSAYQQSKPPGFHHPQVAPFQQPQVPANQAVVPTQQVWKCTCGYEYNLIGAAQCVKCKKNKEAKISPQPAANAQRQPSQHSPPAPQSWDCLNPGCRYVGNSAQNKECENCQTPRPPAHPSPVQQSPPNPLSQTPRPPAHLNPVQQSPPNPLSWSVNIQFEIKMSNQGWICTCSNANSLETNRCGGCSNLSPFAASLQRSLSQRQQP